MTDPDTTITVAPYGSWKSPITPDLILADAVGLAQPILDGQDVYWIEMRPSEGGRSVIVKHTSDGQLMDMIASPFNARTRVHEYGGGDFTVSEGTVYFSNFADQRLYCLTPGSPSQPEPITPDEQMRYADGIIDRQRGHMICIREDHTVEGREAVNTLVSLALDGSGQIQILASGNDFYSSAKLSPDGKRLAWLTWNHPNMPWDGTELWVGELQDDGSLSKTQLVVGNTEESIFQPQWSLDSVLYFVSDRTGWWNLYRWNEDTNTGQVEAVCELQAEFGLPQWSFGMSTYGFVSPTRILCTYVQQGNSFLSSLDTVTGKLDRIETAYTRIGQIKTTPGREQVTFIASSPSAFSSLIQLDLNTLRIDVLRRSNKLELDAGYLSTAQSIEFPTEHGLTAYGFFYPPRNRDYIAPSGELPPLLVMSHGGPTAATSSSLNMGIQYWTSRGIAVLDVNYGGSTGYGREYRQRLAGQWGVVDVDDCANGTKYLAERGLVDGDRLAITGGSAGGYTTLCALTFRHTFKAGASHFGISDLEVLVGDTHKFEARYEVRLVGPYPERRDLYQQRSPINFVDQLSCPVIFFQGLEDRVVPPIQAELMVAALRRKGLPVAYVSFEGEQHGFRKAENIKRAMEGELYFYGRVFGFEIADEIEPVLIENL